MTMVSAAPAQYAAWRRIFHFLKLHLSSPPDNSQLERLLFKKSIQQHNSHFQLEIRAARLWTAVRSIMIEFAAFSSPRPVRRGNVQRQKAPEGGKEGNCN